MTPAFGRYLQADPLGLGAGQSLYGYVHGDPVNMVDPEGTDAVIVNKPFLSSLAEHQAIYIQQSNGYYSLWSDNGYSFQGQDDTGIRQVGLTLEEVGVDASKLGYTDFFQYPRQTTRR